MERIAVRHEKAEDFRRYMNVADKNFSGRYKDILKEEFQNMVSAKESISIRDTVIFQAGELQNYLIIRGKTYDSISGLSASQEVLARDVRKLRDLFQNDPSSVPQDSIDLAIQLDQRVVQEIFKKAQFVNEMMLEAFKSNIYKNPEQRIDLLFLDSVLRTELNDDKLPNTYQFVVTDEYRNPIAFKNAPPNYTLDIDTSNSHATLLFPSNSLDEDLYLYLSFPKQKSFLYKEMWAPLAVNLALMILIFVALVFMFRTILTQKKLSEMKNDFISNMTHEFKTPISTISLACQAMNDSDMVGNQEESMTRPYVNMINDENQRLSILVERILQSATLDRGDIKLQQEKVNLNDVINNVVNNAKFRITGSGGSIHLDVPEEIIEINGDEMHITNLVSNLVDNAIKYSNGEPDVTVSLKREQKKVYLTVADKGIGIKKEHLSKIFDKLYRIPTGNVHNVKGFGLGLSYVKAIADIHDWHIQVRSKYGIGTEFTLTIKE